ncbi:MAG TPA: hypothetical protein VFW65_25360 [Pseudonocardiaceae bacterium]|nr:hypothetical protein [Pseudonocardiaceae bacterium]
MPLPALQPAPRAVRVAGALVAVQGLAALVFAVAVLVQAVHRSSGGGNLYGEAGFFAVLAIAVLAVAAGLVLGLRWARTPAFLVQILLIAVAWYAIHSQFTGLAIGTIVVCAVTVVLLFTAPSRAWAVADSDRAS